MSKIRLKGVDFPEVGHEVEILTENGIARGVKVNGQEIPHAMSVNIRYGVAMYPIVTVAFMAKGVTIEEREKE